jgi:hypothetical protein
MASQDAGLDSKLAARFGGGAVAQQAARQVRSSFETVQRYDFSDMVTASRVLLYAAVAS